MTLYTSRYFSLAVQ